MKLEIEYTSKIVFYSVATVLLIAILQFLTTLTYQMNQSQVIIGKVFDSHEVRITNIEKFLDAAVKQAQQPVASSGEQMQVK